MPANSNKRSTSGDWAKGGSGSAGPSKRVRFGGDREGSLEEVDDSDLLEQRKSRRGAVTVVAYDDGEVSSDDEAVEKKKKKVFVDDIPGAVAKASASDDATASGAPDDDDDEDDMFADPDEIERRRAEKKRQEASKGKGKGKAGKGSGFDWSEIEGEELHLEDLDDEEYDSEGNPKIEAFNMKEELEEGGEIDESGNFIQKADPERFHDNWLEGVSRKEIEAAREAHERKLQQARIEEREAAANAMTETDIYLELANILHPTETVVEALQRLGGGIKRPGAKGAKKKSWQKNKKMDVDDSTQHASATEAPETAEDTERRRSIEKLTDLCDKMMAMGHFDIYQTTYEQAVRHLRRADIIADDWKVGTPVLRPGEQVEAMLEDDPLLSSSTTWEYKWANPPEGQPADEVFGPFSGAEMKSWNDQGFFSQGILVRMVGDSTFEPGESVTF
ncbi:hypothetical protein BGZ98_002151 [Dissophora globulifera]|nr:hypothetical protein BGZ98_002151 [Dissophora globulifera]